MGKKRGILLVNGEWMDAPEEPKEEYGTPPATGTPEAPKVKAPDQVAEAPKAKPEKLPEKSSTGRTVFKGRGKKGK